MLLRGFFIVCRKFCQKKPRPHSTLPLTVKSRLKPRRQGLGQGLPFFRRSQRRRVIRMREKSCLNQYGRRIRFGQQPKRPGPRAPERQRRGGGQRFNHARSQRRPLMQGFDTCGLPGGCQKECLFALAKDRGLPTIDGIFRGSRPLGHRIAGDLGKGVDANARRLPFGHPRRMSICPPGDSFSTKATESSERAKYRAAVMPAGPPPITTTSYRFMS